MSDTAGYLANKNGKHLEDEVEEFLTSQLGILSMLYSETDKKDNILLKNVPYTSIYGGKCRSEFQLCYEGRVIRIECKTQSAHGSVDEKLPYLFLNMSKHVEEVETVAILEGGGFRKGSLDWIRRESKGTKLSVFSLAEFKCYVAEGMKPNKRTIITTIKDWIRNVFI